MILYFNRVITINCINKLENLSYILTSCSQCSCNNIVSPLYLYHKRSGCTVPVMVLYTLSQLYFRILFCIVFYTSLMLYTFCTFSKWYSDPAPLTWEQQRPFRPTEMAIPDGSLYGPSMGHLNKQETPILHQELTLW